MPPRHHPQYPRTDSAPRLRRCPHLLRTSPARRRLKCDGFMCRWRLGPHRRRWRTGQRVTSLWRRRLTNQQQRHRWCCQCAPACVHARSHCTRAHKCRHTPTCKCVRAHANTRALHAAHACMCTAQICACPCVCACRAHMHIHVGAKLCMAGTKLCTADRAGGHALVVGDPTTDTSNNIIMQVGQDDNVCVLGVMVCSMEAAPALTSMPMPRSSMNNPRARCRPVRTTAP